MSTQGTGGPAFPHEYFDKQLNENRVMTGMTLRDYFAAKAMQGLMANDDWNLYEDTAAKTAYAQADAMLKARAA